MCDFCHPKVVSTPVRDDDEFLHETQRPGGIAEQHDAAIQAENHTGRSINDRCMQILPGSDEICGADIGFTCEEWASK